jgi:hypothetical protein
MGQFSHVLKFNSNHMISGYFFTNLFAKQKNCKEIYIKQHFTLFQQKSGEIQMKKDLVCFSSFEKNRLRENKTGFIRAAFSTRLH